MLQFAILYRVAQSDSYIVKWSCTRRSLTARSAPDCIMGLYGANNPRGACFCWILIMLREAFEQTCNNRDFKEMITGIYIIVIFVVDNFFILLFFFNQITNHTSNFINNFYFFVQDLYFILIYISMLDSIIIFVEYIFRSICFYYSIYFIN